MIIDARFEYISDDEIEKFINGYDSYSGTFQDPDLPRRATSDSAGYDIQTPMNIDLDPEEEIIVPTFLKCRIESGWFLGLFPKSGLGWKYHVKIANTIGVVDGDYYNNVDNEGHILVKIRNEGDKPLHIEIGKAFVQGIFLPYGVERLEPMPMKVRAGGFGSTNS